MNGKVIISLMLFANIASAGQLKLDCIPQEMKEMKTPEGKPPMVFHIVLGSQASGQLDTANLNLSAQESGTTMSMEINFATPIGGPGRGPDIPVPVLKKDQNLILGEESDYATLQINSIKSALEGKIENFDVEFVEKSESMPFICVVKK